MARSETLRAITTAADGDRAGVVLVGPLGVGRTRLARAAMAALCETVPGRHPFWVTAGRSTASVPLGAFGHLFGDIESAGAHPGTTSLLLRTARQRLLDVAGGARPVIAVDDAHVLDETSAILLQQLAASGDAFVVMTAPTGVRVPAPVLALWKDGIAERIDIAEFDRAQTARQIVHALSADQPGAVVDDGALDHLWHLSRGNPLALRELVDGGRASGTLRRVGAVWRWDGPFPLTARLIELVGAQEGDLSEAERDLLRLVAFGQPLDSEVAAALAGRDVLASVERRALVRSVRHGVRIDLRVGRPLHAEVLRGLTTPLQEQALYRRLADAAGSAGEATEDPSDPPPHRRRVVAWRALGGLQAVPDELLDAVDGLGADDRRLAPRLLDAVEARNPGPEVAFRLARALIRFGHPERAETLLDGLHRAPSADGTALDDLTLVRAHNLFRGLRAPGPALAALARAAGGTPDADAGPARVALHGLRDRMLGRPAGPVLLAAAGEPDAPLPILALAAADAASRGDYAEAVDLARRSGVLEAGDDGDGGWMRLEVLAARWYALMQSGDLDGADRLATAALADARTRGSDHHASVSVMWRGATAGRRGRPVTAARWLLQAAASAPATRFPFTAPLVAELATALVTTGRVGRAERLLTEARGTSDAPPSGWMHAPHVLIAGVRGRTSQAAELALAAADDHASARGHRLHALHTAVRLGITGAVAPRLVELADGAASPLERAWSDHARALASRDGHGLDAVADRFAGLGSTLLAAEAAAQAVRAHRAAEQPGPAAASAVRSRAWAGGCEDARTPALHLPDGSAELTPREREIASLAACGLSSKAIAGELVVSVRTVDNLLRSVYAKLGVGGRGDLVQVAGLHRSS